MSHFYKFSCILYIYFPHFYPLILYASTAKPSFVCEAVLQQCKILKSTTENEFKKRLDVAFLMQNNLS